MLRNFCDEKFDIIIQAGQSNSEGYGCGNTDSPFIENQDIFYLNSDFTISVAQEKVRGNQIVGNFSLSFCTEYQQSGKLATGRKLLVIRAAIAATGFLDDKWKINDVLFFKMIEMTKTALALNPENKLVALLWHQGETDALKNATKEIHYNHLYCLVKSVRTTFETPNLPFIAADFANQWKTENLPICEPVISAIREVCDTVGNAKFIQTDDLLSNDQASKDGDTIHFCRDALVKLGIRYYKAFCELT